VVWRILSSRSSTRRTVDASGRTRLRLSARACPSFICLSTCSPLCRARRLHSSHRPSPVTSRIIISSSSSRKNGRGALLYLILQIGRRRRFLRCLYLPWRLSPNRRRRRHWSLLQPTPRSLPPLLPPPPAPPPPSPPRPRPRRLLLLLFLHPPTLLSPLPPTSPSCHWCFLESWVARSRRCCGRGARPSCT
jgi:hypothetical protein